MATDTATGFVLLGVALLVVLGVVFVLASRPGPTRAAAKPPRGVHMPGPSLLPAVMALGGSLLGAGFAFRGENEIANPFLALPGLFVFVAGAVAWVQAANREWRETEHGAHDDEAAH